jgi:MYXO-CTERM domain-containing protein
MRHVVLTHCPNATESGDGGSAVSEGRTPAQIEADIARRRQDLAATLDEIAVRVHPVTIARDTRAKAVSALDRTVGQAYVAANRTLTRARAQFVTDEGEPRPDRIVPVVVAVVVLAGAAAALSARRRRR